MRGRRWSLGEKELGRMIEVFRGLKGLMVEKRVSLVIGLCEQTTEREDV